MSTPTPRPWYRQLWPWLLILPPALSVVGGAVTYYLAVTRPDVLVQPGLRAGRRDHEVR